MGQVTAQGGAHSDGGTPGIQHLSMGMRGYNKSLGILFKGNKRERDIFIFLISRTFQSAAQEEEEDGINSIGEFTSRAT